MIIILLIIIILILLFGGSTILALLGNIGGLILLGLVVGLVHSIKNDPYILVFVLALASGFVVLEVINIIYLKFEHNKVFGNEKYKDNDLNFMSFYKKYRLPFAGYSEEYRLSCSGISDMKLLAAFLLGIGIFFMIMP